MPRDVQLKPVNSDCSSLTAQSPCSPAWALRRPVLGLQTLGLRPGTGSTLLPAISILRSRLPFDFHPQISNLTKSGLVGAIGVELQGPLVLRKELEHLKSPAAEEW